MPRSQFLILPLVLLALPASACLWDNDTLLDERRGLPGVAEILAGKWERHSPFFYEHRVRTMLAQIEKDPNDWAAYDNLAVAYEKLGKADQAIALMLKKDGLKPGEYTTEANLGTFSLHTGDFENGTAHIRKALQINPDAHFGREKYQLMVAEYLLEAKQDPSLLDLGSFVLPELLELPGALKAGSDSQVREKLVARRAGMWTRRGQDPERARRPIEGVLGMIRFGTGTSPHLFHALGDLLAYRGDKHLAARAYRRALQFNHPRPDLIQDAIKAVEGTVEDKAELAETVIAGEQAAGEAWVKLYQEYEDGLVRAGREPQTEADYAPFYAKYGSARPPVSTADAMINVMLKFARVGPIAGALCGLLVLYGLIKLTLALGRRRRTAAAR